MYFYRNELKPLFDKHDVYERLNLDFEEVTAAVDVLERERFASHSNEELVEKLLYEHMLAPLVLDINSQTSNFREVVLDKHQGGGTVQLLDIHLPFEGKMGLLHCKPSDPPHARVYGGTTESEVVLTFLPSEAQMADRLKAKIAEQVAMLQEWAEAINRDLAVVERRARQEVLNKLSRRRNQFKNNEALMTALDIPAKKVSADVAVEMPVVRKRVEPQQATGTTPQQEWRLSTAIYEQIINTIVRFAHALERRPSSALQLIPNEATLRDWLIFMLNANYEDETEKEIFVAGEMINGKGKTDILVLHQGRSVFIGECKFWDGDSVFVDAIDQLLGYLVWRDTKAALLLFITQKDVNAVIEKADACLRKHPRFKKALVASDPRRRRDFVLTSNHDDNQLISLALIPVVVSKPAG